MTAETKRGALVLVMGPSGAGKDTLIDYARAHLGATDCFVFVRRAITRPASSGEDHEPVSAQAFRRRVASGGFALSWQAHGLSYGVPAAIDDWLRAGKTVIANASRTILGEARRRYPGLLIVHVTAPPEILARRLTGRGRESEAARQKRLARGDLRRIAGRDVLSIENAGELAAAGEALVNALRRTQS